MENHPFVLNETLIYHHTCDALFKQWNVHTPWAPVACNLC